MADIQQLEAAFRNAHAAGDTQAASMLADAIRQQQAAPVADPRESDWIPTDDNMDEDTSGEFAPRVIPRPDKQVDVLAPAMQVIGGLNKAGFDLIDAPSNIVNLMLSGAGSLLGYEPSRVHVPTKDFDTLKTLRERTTQRAVPKGESMLADALRTGAEWGAGGFVTRGSKLPDVLAGTGAAVGEQLGGKTGELVGGFTGLLGGMKAAQRQAAPKPKTADEKATEFLIENAENPSQAITNIKKGLDEGEIGNLAELSKDRMLFNPVAAAGKGSRVRHELDDITQRRGEQIIEDVSKQFGTGDASQAAQIAALRQTELSQPITQAKQADIQKGFQEAEELANFERQLPAAQAKLGQATQRADQSAARLDTGLPPSQASKSLSDEYQAAETAFRDAVEKPAWDKFAEGNVLPAQKVKMQVSESLKKLTPTELQAVHDKFPKVMGMVKGLDGNVEPRAVHYISSEIKAINENARRGDNFTPANKFLGQVGDELETALKTLGSKEDYSKAVAATAEKYNRFKPTRVGKERAAREAETLGARLLDKKEGGAVVADLVKAADSPAITNAAQNYIKSVASRDGVNDAFLKNYDELLERFPTLKAELTQAKKAQDELVEAGKGVEQAAKVDADKAAKLPRAIEQSKAKSTAAAEAKAKRLSKSISNLNLQGFRANPNKYLDTALKGSTDDLTKLNRQMGRTEGGKSALKAAVKARVMDKIVKRKGGKETVPYGAVDEFYSVRKNLVDSGVLSKTEAAEIDKALQRADVSGLKRNAAVQKADEAGQVINDIASSASAVAALGLLPASNQLMLAGTVKRLVSRVLKKESIDTKAIDALNDMIVNPERFLKGVANRKITTEKELEKFIQSYLNTGSQAIAEE